MKSFRIAATSARSRVATVVMIGSLLPGIAAAAACFGSSIKSPIPFMGNKGEVFALDDGSMWAVRDGYAYLYDYDPKISLCPQLKTILVKGKTIPIERAAVRKSATEERRGPRRIVTSSRLSGELNGWQGETRFKLDNGQIWQPDGYEYGYAYKTRPAVTIFLRGKHHEMQVEGLDSTIRVKRLQ